MKTLLSSLVFFACIYNISAQNYERTDDRGYRTTYDRVHVMPDGSWATLIRSGEYSYFPVETGLIQYFNASGELQWETQPTAAKELIITEDSNLAVFSAYGGGCDVGEAYPMFTTVLDTDGQVVSVNTLHVEVDIFNAEVQGCVVDSIIVLATGQYSFFNDYSTQLIGVNFNTDSLWKLLLNYDNISHIVKQGELAVAIAENEILRVNTIGEKVDSLDIDEMPVHASSWGNDEVLLTMSDGIYALDAALNLSQVMTYPEPAIPDEMLSETDKLYLIYPDVIHVYDDTYALEETREIDVFPDFVVKDVALSNDSLIVAGNRPFLTTLRDLITGNHDFETSTGALRVIPPEDETPDHFPDAALRHLTLTDYTASGWGWSSSHGVNTSFYLINEGDVVIENVIVNFTANTNPISCGIFGKTQQYGDLGLAPGDSLMLSMEQVQFNDYYYIWPADSSQIEYCLYVTQPNQLYDRVTDNDQVCGSVDIGVGLNELPVGITSVYPNPAGELVTIDFSETNESDILQIYDATGKHIEAFSVNRRTQLTLDVADWNMGLYYFRIVSDGKFSDPVKVSIVH